METYESQISFGDPGFRLNRTMQYGNKKMETNKIEKVTV